MRPYLNKSASMRKPEAAARFPGIQSGLKTPYGRPGAAISAFTALSPPDMRSAPTAAGVPCDAAVLEMAHKPSARRSYGTARKTGSSRRFATASCAALERGQAIATSGNA